MATTAPLAEPTELPLPAAASAVARAAERYAPRWHADAPERVAAANDWSDGAEGWIAWRNHLKSRRRPKRLAKLLPSSSNPLLWCLPDGANFAAAAEFALELSAPRSGTSRDASGAVHTLVVWLESAVDRPASAALSIEALACCQALPAAAQVVSAGQWWAALERLTALASSVGELTLDDDPLCHQLLSGELALKLAWLFPEIADCRALASSGRSALEDGLAVVLDGEGLPHHKCLPLLRPLLACWTRARALSLELQHGCWDEEADAQYRNLLTHAVRLTRKDGSQSLCDAAAGAWQPDLFAAALRFADGKTRRAADLVLPGRKRPSGAGDVRLPETAIHSEWSGIGVLRRQWRAGSEMLTAAYGDGPLLTELQLGSDIVWSGDLTPSIAIDGRPALPTGPWEEVCWVSDEDVDYLELERVLDGGLRVQRQMLLARQDRFLFLADALLCQEPHKLDYRLRVPLRPGVSLAPGETTREGYLGGRKPRATVLPLALPEWRSDPRGGALEAVAGGLELTQSAQARALFAPLFFDLAPSRLHRPLTWRQLTVAEQRRRCPADVAVGYRVHAGDKQWLIYRSLAAPAVRSVLGANLVGDFVLGRFTKTGEIVKLIEVE